MELVVPYVVDRLAPRTRRIAEEQGARLVDVGGSDWAYGVLLKELWEREEPVLIMEHDMAPTDEQLEELRECSEPWCAFSYEPQPPDLRLVMLGCCKIGPELMRATQFIWLQPIPWWHCDIRISAMARGAGFEPHQHFPDVEHLNSRRAFEAVS